MADIKRENRFAMGVALFVLILLIPLCLIMPVKGAEKLYLLGLAWFLFGGYILLSSPYFKSKMRNFQRKMGFITAFLPLAMIGLYCLYGGIFGFFSPKGAGIFALYIGIPALIGALLWKKKGQLTFWDLIIILIIWYPIEFNLLPQANLPVSGQIRLPLHFFLALLPAMYLFVVTRENNLIGYRYNLTLKDLGIIFASLVAISVIIIPLGLHLNFLHYGPKNLGFLKIGGIFLGTFFLVALPEEFLFRGLLYNLFDKWCGKPRIFILPLLLTSIVFGLTHWNNGHPQPNWNYVLLAGIAGFFYGLAYIRTKSVVASALVHTCVNTLWAIFLK